MALALEDNYSNVEDADNDKVHDYKKKPRRVFKDMMKWGLAPVAPPSVVPQAKKKQYLPRFVGTSSGLTFDFKKLKQDVKTNS